MIKLLCSTLFLAFSIIIFSSYSTGPSSGGAGNRTGSPGSAGTCSVGTACHNTPPLTPTLSQFLTLFDKTTNTFAPVNTYTGGHLYEVTLQGSNVNTGFTQFGFQALAMASPSNVQAGTIIVTNQTEHQLASVNGIQIIEHNQRIQSLSTTLTAVFDWQAPPTGTGTVKLYGIINAVNGDFDRTGDRHSGGNNVTLTEQAPLSISLKYFNATKTNSGNRISWEIESAYKGEFIIEKSYDGSTFNSISSIEPAADDADYLFIDQEIKTAFYRLRIRASGLPGDLLSKTIEAKRTNPKTVSVLAYPNPFKDQLTVMLQDPVSSNSSLKVYSMDGRCFQQLDLKDNIVRLEMAKYPSGCYLIQINNGDEQHIITAQKY
jgi:hypothetical protein